MPELVAETVLDTGENSRRESTQKGSTDLSLPGLTGQSSILRPLVTGSPGQAGR